MKKNPFIQGAMIATIGIVISKILGIIYVIPFYAIIGTKGGALYGYAYAMYSIFLNLSSIGIPLAISRLTSEYNALDQDYLKERTFKIGKKVITTLSCISFAILFIFAPNIAHIFIGDIKGGNTIDDVTFVIRIISTAVLVVPTLSVTKGYLQGHKYITTSTISQVVEQAARVVLIIVGSYVAVKVLGLPTKVGVGVATFGATFGGLIAYLYLLFKMHKNKDLVIKNPTPTREDAKIKTKDIVITILRYAAPFIFSSLILSFYDFVDLSTVIKTLVEGLHFKVGDAETIMSIFSTWGNKLESIVAAVSTGLTTSIIPNITGSFVKGNNADVQNKINRSLQILLFIIIPMTLGLSLLAKPIWTVFYGYNTLSAHIFAYYIMIAIPSCLLVTLNVIIQSLNEQGRMFIYITAGFLVKVIFNVPLMYSFYRLGFNAGYGVTTASMLGFFTSCFLILNRLHKTTGVNYEDTVKKILYIIYACLIMTLVILAFQFVLPIDVHNRIPALILTIVYTIIGSIAYFGVTYKMGLLTEVFGEAFVNKMLRKLKLNKR